MVINQQHCSIWTCLSRCLSVRQVAKTTYNTVGLTHIWIDAKSFSFPLWLTKLQSLPWFSSMKLKDVHGNQLLKITPDIQRVGLDSCARCSHCNSKCANLASQTSSWNILASSDRSPLQVIWYRWRSFDNGILTSIHRLLRETLWLPVTNYKLQKID